ncbi:translation initiation factor eIF 4e-like domain-containing protein [Mycena metata]|uniref:Translation initiation factor eIF 4e-like domain-containing protein n=1 Tax=Mycena metata TaxID=1033252 RepID=A0AAD7P0H4_9AGAR|nr:translation initiation factor eIF 4e-like domain-containing protein [Mycena metata]
MVQNDGTKPWIWVKRSAPSREDTGAEEALEEGEDLLKEITARVEEIKNDESIPVRSSKKTGAKGKKEVREEAQAQATEKFKEIALKHEFVSGKWLSFAPPDKVDVIWSNLATSIVSGPLAATAAFGAKVATSPEEGTATQHLICIYMPDVYDKDAVTEVMKVLLRHHGMNLSGVKSNLYTALGIDSKHASGLPSTTWKTTALLPEKESKALKEAYFENLKAAAPKAATDKPAAAKPAAKAQPKKKQAEDDPAELKSKVKAPAAKGKRAKESDDEDDEEEEERPKKKKALKK